LAGAEKILLVEDELRLQKLTRLALKKFGGFEVKACSNGLEALEAISTFQPDLILLDVRMPEMDGPTTLIELRKIETCQSTPIIFTTGNISAEDRQKYFEMGAVDVIDKPYDPKDLSDKLQAFF